VPGVSQDEERGVIAYLSTELRAGRGRVLVTIEPQFEISTQESASLAVSAAESYTGVYLGDKDVIFTIKANAPIIGGPSAGAAMAISLVALIEGYQLNPRTIITGEIGAQGQILPVGGLQRKIDVSASEGIEIFLIPKGERLQVVYETRSEKEEIFPGIFIYRTIQVPRDIDIVEYANQTYAMSVIEIADVGEALEYMVVT
jgi:uncharacterized protein